MPDEHLVMQDAALRESTTPADEPPREGTAPLPVAPGIAEPGGSAVQGGAVGAGGPSGPAAPGPVAARGLQPPPAAGRRGLVYLLLCLVFGALLLAPMLAGSAAGTPPDPCGDGASIIQAAALPAGPDLPPRLLALLRPPGFPNVVQGADPGCEAMYRSDDNGLTWTESFSATAEAPAAMLPVAGGMRAYLLTIRMHFPLYVATNVYRSDRQGAPWSWTRISPQGRRDVPVVMATDMLVGDDGSVVLREGNGDGAALVRSVDGGATWQALAVPGISSVASVVLLDRPGGAGPLIAVAPPTYRATRPPGLISADGGATWRPLGVLPAGPGRRGLQALLSVDGTEHALVLDLVARASVVQQRTVARYASLDGGATWAPVRCGSRPAPGCAPPARWAGTGLHRYVLYHGRLFQARGGGPWSPLPVALPVRSATVLQLLAASGTAGDALYLVTPAAIWRLDGRSWHSASTGLPVARPQPVEA